MAAQPSLPFLLTVNWDLPCDHRRCWDTYKPVCLAAFSWAEQQSLLQRGGYPPPQLMHLLSWGCPALEERCAPRDGPHCCWQSLLWQNLEALSFPSSPGGPDWVACSSRAGALFPAGLLLSVLWKSGLYWWQRSQEAPPLPSAGSENGLQVTC